MSNKKNSKSKTKSSSKSKTNTRKRKISNKQSVDNMKYEIANELGINLGPDASSRANGSVGGEITKRLVQRGLNKKSGNNRK